MPLELQGTEELCKISLSVTRNDTDKTEAYLLILSKSLESVVGKNELDAAEFSKEDTLSESETRNVYEFQRTHDNIFASFHFHNTGRLIMFAVPGAVEPGAEGQSAARGPYGMGRGRQMSPEERLAQMQAENKYAFLIDRMPD